ncbi:GNAT family N-acetyltransferase [Alphaproteobacteria bacterium]|jgi:ribosomal-protein-alanine N-acetyltransferase|nr:GNAT family N-acetyltransferase [Alphaproteobacteria bacterium]
MQISFSVMTEADLAAIDAIHDQASAKLKGMMDQPAFAGMMVYSMETMTDLPVGYIAGLSIMGEADIIDLAVGMPYRRQGIGRQMVMRFCEQHGQHMTHLEVAASNHAARQLYQSLGFAETGRRRGYYPSEKGMTHADDAVRMTRSGLTG